ILHKRGGVVPTWPLLIVKVAPPLPLRKETVPSNQSVRSVLRDASAGVRGPGIVLEPPPGRWTPPSRSRTASSGSAPFPALRPRPGRRNPAAILHDEEHSAFPAGNRCVWQ